MIHLPFWSFGSTDFRNWGFWHCSSVLKNYNSSRGKDSVVRFGFLLFSQGEVLTESTGFKMHNP